MSKYYNIVKRNYDNGYWAESKVRDAVVKAWISEEEFKEITGKDYEVNQND